MKKRIYGQQKLIKDIRIKLGYDQDGDDEGSRHFRSDPFDKEGAESDFSLDEDERCLPNENFLDLKIKEGIIDQKWVEALQRAKGIHTSLHSKEFTTIISIDFFNHESKVTEPGYGYNPRYNSAFSFKDKMDHFYVQELAKQRLHFDVF